MKKTSVLLLLLAMFVSFSQVFAADTSELQKDFAPLNGTVLLQDGNRYMIDLDSDAGLRPGDVMTLVLASDKALAKTLSSTKTLPVGFYKVSEVKQGYSYISAIQGKFSPQKGSLVIRYHKVPARILGADKVLATEIKAALGQLNWLADGSSKNALLNFQLSDNQLSVLNAEGALLYQYHLTSDRFVSSVKPQQPEFPSLQEREPHGFIRSMMKDAVEMIDKAIN